MTIRPAKIEDAPLIDALLQACKVHMESNGIFQWTTAYPNPTITLEDIAKKQIYVLAGDKLAGMIVFNEEQEEEYAEVDWAFNNLPILVIHRLAVSPEFQGQGCARQLMDFVEDYALKNAYRSIRLDSFTKNPRALDLYKRRGYLVRGTVEFPGKTAPFHCFEKDI